MKIAIHFIDDRVEDSYAPKWIEFCKTNDIDYKIVNCYDSDIILQLKDCDALLWHWDQLDYKALLFARGLTHSLDRDDFVIYPDVNTSWHYDDKVGQKYLLESIGAPLVKSYAFYDRESAVKWIENTTFPKVFKLRSGAGSYNVKLIRDKEQALSYTKIAFGNGFFPLSKASVLNERIWTFKKNRDLKSFLNISRGIYRYIFPNKIYKNLPVEKNYLYAQDFIDGCDHDIRVFAMGDRAVTKKRFTRGDDFRASGSGLMTWNDIPKECVKMAFEVMDNIKAQSLAFDFVKDKDGYKIVEISYVASVRGFPDCPGYWNRDIEWIDAPVRVEFFIIEDLINKIKKIKDNI
jgi:hypothetical protein